MTPCLESGEPIHLDRFAHTKGLNLTHSTVVRLKQSKLESSSLSV